MGVGSNRLAAPEGDERAHLQQSEKRYVLGISAPHAAYFGLVHRANAAEVAAGCMIVNDGDPNPTATWRIERSSTGTKSNVFARGDERRHGGGTGVVWARTSIRMTTKERNHRSRWQRASGWNAKTTPVAGPRESPLATTLDRSVHRPTSGWMASHTGLVAGHRVS